MTGLRWILRPMLFSTNEQVYIAFHLWSGNFLALQMYTYSMY